MKNITINVKQNEEKIVPFFWIDGQENEYNITAKIKGDNATLTILCIFFGTKKNSVIFNTDVTHLGTNTKSLTLIRAVLLDNAVLSNDGMIRIEKGAKNTNGYFDSKILLFNDAKGRSVPSLEIDENEVKAGHGSTIGRPDENQLVYLRSRGLTEKEAEKLLISGFFEPIITQMPEIEKRLVKSKLKQQLAFLT